MRQRQGGVQRPDVVRPRRVAEGVRAWRVADVGHRPRDRTSDRRVGLPLPMNASLFPP